MIPATYVPLGFAAAIRSAASRRRGKTAIIAGERRLTYAQLVERIDRVAGGARAQHGLGLGRRALLLAPNCLEFIEIVIGLAQLGMATATPSPRLSAREIGEIIADCEPDLIFVDAASRALLGSSEVPAIVLGEDYDRWLARSAPLTEPPEVPEWQTFSIPYTSGTTGRAKGVLLPQRSRILACHAMAAEYGCYGPDDSHLAAAPLCHGGGFGLAIPSVYFGGTLELLARFDAEQFLRRLAAGRYTSTFLVPTQFHQIFALGESRLRELGPWPGLRTLISNAAPLSQSMKERIVGAFGGDALFECYGTTESGIIANIRPADQLRKVQCVGLPFANTAIELRDDAGAVVGPNEVGEVFTRSPYFFNGYLNNPAETAATFRDGWISVGDLARLDEEGYLYIVGRKKDMVISGGLNIYPREIEELLLTHPQVEEAAVIGIPDAQWGESLKAFIVFRGAPPETADIVAFCKAALASYKVPKLIEAIDALPKNANGKVLKRELKDRGPERDADPDPERD
jgi:long-chain acyl-CoA synthetase